MSQNSMGNTPLATNSLTQLGCEIFIRKHKMAYELQRKIYPIALSFLHAMQELRDREMMERQKKRKEPR